MSLFEKRNINVPNLNIESFGIYWKSNSWSADEHYDKYYIASLVFDINTLFSNYKKVVYLPILFLDDKVNTYIFLLMAKKCAIILVDKKHNFSI